MKKCDELKGPSCLTAAADDEPLFVLRANDEAAPKTVLDWMGHYIDSKGGVAKLTDTQLKKVKDAASIAEAMKAWKVAHTPTYYTRPEGIIGGPCLHCAGSQPEHVGKTCDEVRGARANAVQRLLDGVLHNSERS